MFCFVNKGTLWYVMSCFPSQPRLGTQELYIFFLSDVKYQRNIGCAHVGEDCKTLEIN